MFANRTVRGVRVPAVAFYVVAVMAIVLYGRHIRRHRKRDVLERKIIDHPSCPGFDGWALTHLFFFGVLGLFYPGHYLQALVVSVGWEGVEHALGSCPLEVSGRRLQLVGDQDEDGNPIVPAAGEEPRYWYGRFVTDPAFNLAGYIIGSAIAERYWPVTATPTA